MMCLKLANKRYISIFVAVFAIILVLYWYYQHNQESRDNPMGFQAQLCDAGKINQLSVLLVAIADDEYDSFPECEIDSADSMAMLHTLKALEDECQEHNLLKQTISLGRCDPDAPEASQWNASDRMKCARSFIGLCSSKDPIISYILQQSSKEAL